MLQVYITKFQLVTLNPEKYITIRINWIRKEDLHPVSSTTTHSHNPLHSHEGEITAAFLSIKYFITQEDLKRWEALCNFAKTHLKASYPTADI